MRNPLTAPLPPRHSRAGSPAPVCLLTALVLALALPGCGLPRKADKVFLTSTRPRVDVFVRSHGAPARKLFLQLDSVRLREARGAELELELHRDQLDSVESRRRVSFAGGAVQAASYDAIIIALRGAAIERDGRRSQLSLNTATAELEGESLEPELLVLEVPIRLRVRPTDAASVFLDWDIDASLDDQGNLQPVFSLSTEGRQVLLGRMYVTDGASSSLLAVERSSGEVLASVGVGAEPRDLAVSRDLRRIFVANARDGSLSVVDLRQNLVTSTLQIRIGAGTWDVAVLDRGDELLATNRSIDSVVFFDTNQSTKLAEVAVGRRPTRIAVSSRLNRAFVANSLSNDVSVLDLNSRSLVGTVGVESGPVDLVLDRRERELFVAHKISQDLLVIDTTTLAAVDSIFIGGDATALLADRRRDRIYVARSNPAELAVVDRRLSAVVRRIPLSGPISSLAQPIDGSVIYGASPELGGVLPIDILSAKQGELIPCGQRPTSVVFVD